MKMVISLVTSVLCALSFSASADTAAPKAAQKPSKAAKLSDAELDKVTAGVTTIIFNPGKANVLIFHKRGLTCVNCI